MLERYHWWEIYTIWEKSEYKCQDLVVHRVWQPFYDNIIFVNFWSFIIDGILLISITMTPVGQLTLVISYIVLGLLLEPFAKMARYAVVNECYGPQTKEKFGDFGEWLDSLMYYYWLGLLLVLSMTMIVPVYQVIVASSITIFMVVNSFVLLALPIVSLIIPFFGGAIFATSYILILWAFFVGGIPLYFGVGYTLLILVPLVVSRAELFWELSNIINAIEDGFTQQSTISY